MKAIPALIWKELKECQWALIAGGAIFVAMPTLVTVLLAGRLPDLGHVAFGLVIGLGGLYAILVGVHSASSDLKPGLEPFWRSRPIQLARWTAVKYFLGALVVLLVTASPLAIEAVLVLRWGSGSPGDQLAMLLGHSFTLVLVYSVAFLFGSLVGEPLKAALLSLAAGILVYFLPVLFPVLEPWSVINLLGDWPRPRQIDSEMLTGLIGRDHYTVGFPLPGVGWITVPAAYYVYLGQRNGKPRVTLRDRRTDNPQSSLIGGLYVGSDVFPEAFRPPTPLPPGREGKVPQDGRPHRRRPDGRSDRRVGLESLPLAS